MGPFLNANALLAILQQLIWEQSVKILGNP
jgi:hypothetical protein